MVLTRTRVAIEQLLMFFSDTHGGMFGLSRKKLADTGCPIVMPRCAWLEGEHALLLTKRVLHNLGSFPETLYSR